MKDHGPVTILDVLDEDTLTSALRCISHRKRSPGIDGIKGENLPEYWEKSSQEITKRLLHGIYRPHPVVTIKIPKPNSTEKRRIEIPCVVDRMLQNALLYVLSPCFEPSFLPSSYAFRKGGGCHKALECCLRELRLNTSWVIDLDIRHFFDKVDHGILLSIIKRTIRDKRLLHLISSYIGVDVMNGGSVHRDLYPHRSPLYRHSDLSRCRNQMGDRRCTVNRLRSQPDPLCDPLHETQGLCLCCNG